MRCVRESPGTRCERWEMLGISTTSTSGARCLALRCCCSHCKLKHGWLWLALKALLQRSHWVQPRCPVLVREPGYGERNWPRHDCRMLGALFVVMSLTFPSVQVVRSPIRSTPSLFRHCSLEHSARVDLHYASPERRC
jgi:hypothetical protein